MKYKIGDKVETPLGVGKLVDISQNNETKFKVAYGTRTTWYAHDEITSYRTAHEKLIEMGYESTKGNNFTKYRHDELPRITIYNDNTYSCSDTNLELSRILTQYLEELENDK